MKKSILSIFGMLLIVGTITAQTGVKALKKATKEAAKYTTDIKANSENKAKAFELLEVAFQSDEVNTNGKAWNKKGAIYNKIANTEMTATFLPGADKALATMDAGVNAYESYNKAISLAAGSKKVLKPALVGLMETENHVNNIGITAFSEKNYAAAFKNFDVAIKIYDILNSNNKKSRLDVDSIKNEHVFYTALAAYYGDMKTESVPYFEQNIACSNPNPISFETLYEVFAESDKAKAAEYLAKGREIYPDNTGLLYKEINLYLAEGKLEELIAKLKSAIVKEPANASLYMTLGSVYDQLQVKEGADGNAAKSKEYFDLAFDYYSQAVTKDETSSTSLYSLGALYYNQAAAMTTSINEFANDYTPAGMKKYDAAKKEMDETFAKSLPYFEKAINVTPDDIGALQALKEIYARQDNIEKSNEMKVRMEAIQAKSGN